MATLWIGLLLVVMGALASAIFPPIITFLGMLTSYLEVPASQPVAADLFLIQTGYPKLLYVFIPLWIW